MSDVIKPYFYYLNSENTMVDLTKPPFIGDISNDLVGFKWTPITQGQAVQKVVKFEKVMNEKKFKVLVSGDSYADYKANLDRFLQYTDKDINNLKMGRLYVGEYYLECYIVASGKPKRYLGTNKTLIQLSVLCENGNWRKEAHVLKSDVGFEPGEGYNDNYTANGITYPYDYDYDYAAPFSRGEIFNESYMDADFEIRLIGATQSPTVTIGDNVYGFIDLTLSDGEYITVNSKNKTAILHKINGDEENVFRFRNREYRLYDKIKGGWNDVVIEDENCKVDIKLFYERSEPKWSDTLWI